LHSGTRRGPRRSRTSAAPQWAGAVQPLGPPQPCQRPRRPFHRRHSPRHRQRLRQRHRQRNRHRHGQHSQPHVHLFRRRRHFRLFRRRPRRDLWIRTIVQWVRTWGGTPPRKSGAAGSTTSVMGIRHCPQPLQIPTIAMTASRTGRLVGRWPKRSGAAGFTARAAQTRAVVDVPPSGLRLRPMIVQPGSPIG